MRYHNITKDDMLNGEGLRTVLGVAGCSHNCPQCHNPVTWDINGGLAFDEAAKEELKRLIRQYGVEIIAIGNGTASRESEAFVAEVLKEVPNVSYVIVNESGASVYSASELARHEFQELTVEKR